VEGRLQRRQNRWGVERVFHAPSAFSRRPPLPLIECSHLCRTFSEGASRSTDESVEGASTRRPALADATFTVERGEFVAVVGPSGSGKSTLLTLLGGLDRPTTGRLVIDGVDMSNATEAELDRHRRERVGFIFQSFHLNPRRTALENVLLPLVFAPSGEASAADLARRRLEQVGLAPLADRPVSTLSGGQRQRVAIARALVRNPSLLLADEPVGNLDAGTGREIVDLLRAINRDQGVTILAVSHDALLLEAAGRLLEMREGRLLEGGAASHTRAISPLPSATPEATP